MEAGYVSRLYKRYKRDLPVWAGASTGVGLYEYLAGAMLPLIIAAGGLSIVLIPAAIYSVAELAKYLRRKKGQ